MRSPAGILSGDEVLPFDMIVRMQADFESFVTHGPERIATATRDMWTRKKRAIEQSPYAVMLDNGSARNFAEESGPKDPPQRASCVIRPDAEKKSRVRPVAPQQAYQTRNAFARAPQRIHVDLERELRSA
jgi:hypothetical protein